MPQSVDPSDQLSAAKRKLIVAAGDIDPLRGLREKPLVMVGTAALMGAVLGSSRGTISGSVKLVGGALKFLRPMTVVFSRFLLSRMAHHHEHEAMKNAEKAEEHAAAAAAHAAAASANPAV
jgi:hypothetical protein